MISIDRPPVVVSHIFVQMSISTPTRLPFPLLCSALCFVKILILFPEGLFWHAHVLFCIHQLTNTHSCALQCTTLVPAIGWGDGNRGWKTCVQHSRPCLNVHRKAGGKKNTHKSKGHTLLKAHFTKVTKL